MTTIRVTITLFLLSIVLVLAQLSAAAATDEIDCAHDESCNIKIACPSKALLQKSQQRKHLAEGVSESGTNVHLGEEMQHDAKLTVQRGDMGNIAESKINVGKSRRKPKVIYALFTSGSEKYRRKLESIMDTWGRSLISEGRFIAIGGNTYPQEYTRPGAVMSVDCDDSADGLSCKEATLIIEGAKRKADWLFISGEDNYVVPDVVERFLEEQDPGRAVAFGCTDCGKGHIPAGMSCLGVNESGGFCGGCGYAISGAALSELTRQGEGNLIQEYGGRIKQTVANDMQTSCSLRNHGASLESLGFPTEGNAIFGITDYENFLRRQGKYEVGVYHFIEADVMRWMHGFRQQLPEKDLLFLEAKAFDRGCVIGMNEPKWKKQYNDCLKRHRKLRRF